MMFSIGQGDGNIDHLKAEWSFVQKFLHPGLHRRNVLFGHRAADHGASELKAGTARQWLDIDTYVTELTVSTRLFFKTRMLGYWFTNSFFVSDLRYLCDQRNAVLFL